MGREPADAVRPEELWERALTVLMGLVPADAGQWYRLPLAAASRLAEDYGCGVAALDDTGRPRPRTATQTARRMGLSPATVRGYVAAPHRKLEAAGHTAALLRRGRELGLLIDRYGARRPAD
nr:hypothetical protein [Streptomyces sp. SID13726]